MKNNTLPLCAVLLAMGCALMHHNIQAAQDTHSDLLFQPFHNHPCMSFMDVNYDSNNPNETFNMLKGDNTCIPFFIEDFTFYMPPDHQHSSHDVQQYNNDTTTFISEEDIFGVSQPINHDNADTKNDASSFSTNTNNYSLVKNIY